MIWNPKFSRKDVIMTDLEDAYERSKHSKFTFYTRKFIEDIVNGRILAYNWFRELVNNGRLPTKGEVTRTVSGEFYHFRDLMDDPSPHGMSASLCVNVIRDAYTMMYGWPLITQDVLDEMAAVFNGKRVLEVMGGTGYLAALLCTRGIDVRCTDDMSWNYRYPFTEVEKLDAISAIEKYHKSTDMILMSWPPYGSEVDCDVLDLATRYHKTLVVIGEIGDCTGSAKFYDTVFYGNEYDVDEYCVSSYAPFLGLHDCVSVITPASSDR